MPVPRSQIATSSYGDSVETIEIAPGVHVPAGFLRAIKVADGEAIDLVATSDGRLHVSDAGVQAALAVLAEATVIETAEGAMTAVGNTVEILFDSPTLTTAYVEVRAGNATTFEVGVQEYREITDGNGASTIQGFSVPGYREMSPGGLDTVTTEQNLYYPVSPSTRGFLFRLLEVTGPTAEVRVRVVVYPSTRPVVGPVPVGYHQAVLDENPRALTSAGTTYTSVLMVPSVPMRWRDDGIAPTATSGMPVMAGQPFMLDRVATGFQYIAQDATGMLDFSYYRDL